MKVFLANDAGRDNHAGCRAVSDAHDKMLRRLQAEIICIHYVREGQEIDAGSEETSIKRALDGPWGQPIRDCDILVVNGEGTIHHGAGHHLLAMLGAAQKLGKKTFLINAVLQEVNKYHAVFRHLNGITVREPNSALLAKKLGAARVDIVPDSCMEADFIEEPAEDFEGEIVVGDCHPQLKEYVELLHEYGRGKPFWNMEDEKRSYDWRQSLATLKTARLYVTGRHHGIYFCAMAGIPFVALPSNTYKVESLLEWSRCKIPICTKLEELEDSVDFALTHCEEFEKFRDFLLKQRPLRTFDRWPGNRKPLKTEGGFNQSGFHLLTATAAVQNLDLRLDSYRTRVAELEERLRPEKSDHMEKHRKNEKQIAVLQRQEKEQLILKLESDLAARIDEQENIKKALEKFTDKLEEKQRTIIKSLGEEFFKYNNSNASSFGQLIIAHLNAFEKKIGSEIGQHQREAEQRLRQKLENVGQESGKLKLQLEEARQKIDNLQRELEQKKARWQSSENHYRDMVFKRNYLQFELDELRQSNAYKTGVAIRSLFHRVVPKMKKFGSHQYKNKRRHFLKSRPKNLLKVMSPKAVIVSRSQPNSGPRFHDAYLKVLHFSLTPLAGSPIRVSRLLDRSLFISSICINNRAKYNDGRSFDYDLCYSPNGRPDGSEEILRSLLDEADIIHFHNESYFNRFPIFDSYIREKPCCVQWHSGPDELAHRLSISIDEISAYREIPTLVIAQKQSRYYPGAIAVPNAVDITKEPYLPAARSNDKIEICYSPTEDVLPFSKLCRDKGRDEILVALKTIQDKYPEKVTVTILENLPLEECLRIKRRCHIGIDDIKSGGYHLSSHEFLSMGAVTIANLDSQMREFLSEYVGCPEEALPWYQADPENLVARVEELIYDQRMIEELGRESRVWMEKYWTQDFVVKKFKQAYISVIERYQ